MYEKKRVLIAIKTYPLPSTSYQEVVCTAGVLEDGSFIRLYPINYRYRPYWQWYKKYQWIEVEAIKHDRDPRKESYRPKVDSIRIVSDPLSTRNRWTEREKYVLAQGSRTMEELWDLQHTDRTSLGIIRPSEINDFIIEPDLEDWGPQQKELFQQLHLFGPDQKPLEKIPFKFYYVFRCDDPRCNGHKMMIEDWEIGQLYRSMRNRYHSPEIAVEKVRQKFFHQMCAPNIDTHFFVGTVLRHGTWVVVGVFWPKKV